MLEKQGGNVMNESNVNTGTSVTERSLTPWASKKRKLKNIPHLEMAHGQVYTMDIPNSDVRKIYLQRIDQANPPLDVSTNPQQELSQIQTIQVIPPDICDPIPSSGSECSPLSKPAPSDLLSSRKVCQEATFVKNSGDEKKEVSRVMSF